MNPHQMQLITPLFGARVIALVTLLAIAPMFSAGHTKQDYVLSCIISGLMAMGMLAQVVSSFKKSGLVGRKRWIWWSATWIYGLWIVFVFAAYFLAWS